MANTHSIDLERSSSQYLSITDAAQTGLSAGGDMTLEFWVKLETDVAGITQGLMSKTGLASNRSWLLRAQSGNTIEFFISADGTNSTIASLSQVLTVGTWYHIAAAYDASAGTVDWYIDGTFKEQDTSMNTSLFDSSADFMIGRQGEASSNYVDGKMDDVRYWNTVRNATEIGDNYDKELVGNETGLQGYWKLNNSLLDETSNNNDLTNNNSAVFSTDVPFTGAVAFTPKIMIF